MDGRGYALFDTSIGRCGIAWTSRGIAAVSLPDSRAASARARLSRRAEGAEEAPPPADVSETISAICKLLHGERVDLGQVKLDDGGAPGFETSVYALARAIAPGATATYGEIAGRLGDPQLARAVGQALGRNPWPIIVPCHRVLAAEGRTGGFSAPGGATAKLQLLTLERAALSPEPLLFSDLPLAAR